MMMNTLYKRFYNRSIVVTQHYHQYNLVPLLRVSPVNLNQSQSSTIRSYSSQNNHTPTIDQEKEVSRKQEIDSIFSKLFGNTQNNNTSSNTNTTTNTNKNGNLEESKPKPFNFIFNKKATIPTNNNNNNNNEESFNIGSMLSSFNSKATTNNNNQQKQQYTFSQPPQQIPFSETTNNNNNNRFNRSSTFSLNIAPLKNYSQLIKRYKEEDDKGIHMITFMIEDVPREIDGKTLEQLILGNLEDLKIKTICFERVTDYSLRGNHHSVFVAVHYYKSNQPQQSFTKDNIIKSDSPLESIIGSLSTSPIIDTQTTTTASPINILSLKSPIYDNSPSEIYNRFNLFGFIIDGTRHKAIESTHISSLKLKGLPYSLNEHTLRRMIDEQMPKLKHLYTIKFTRAATDAHQPVNGRHNGHCTINFGSHSDAVEAYQSIGYLKLSRPIQVSWSRSVFGATDESSNLLTKISISKNKQMAELILMRKVIDLSSQIQNIDGGIDQQPTLKK